MSSMRRVKAGNAVVESLALAVVIALVWGSVCVTKKVWPFGSMVIDIGDMAEQCVPMYTHLWDVLHGQKSLLFDWSTGCGNNMAGVVLHFGSISPFNIFSFLSHGQR